jgi:hypothetical protein
MVKSSTAVKNETSFITIIVTAPVIIIIVISSSFASAYFMIGLWASE